MAFQFNFNLPNLNLSLPPPPILIDASDFSTKLRHPSHVETLGLESSSASKSYNDLYHNFILPVVGDYAHKFRLSCPYVIRGIKDQQLLVDCASNYIESIHLNLNNNSTLMAKIDQIPKIEVITSAELSLHPQHEITLNFLDLPILTRYVTASNWQIAIRFRQPPPSYYQLQYDLMFVPDHTYVTTLRQTDFVITYLTKQKKLELVFQQGQVRLKV